MSLNVPFIQSFMEEQVAFNKLLGVKLVHAKDGMTCLEIPFRPELIGDPARPALHGGVLSTLVDACGGATIWTRLGPHDRISTIDLRVDYLRPARLERLLAEGTLLRLGNHVAVAQVKVFHAGGENEPLVIGVVTYNVHKKRG